MRGPAKLATYLGVGMALAGFVLIFLAWNGAAELDYIQGQFPYMLSGGVGGLALIVTGMAVLLVQTQREAGARRTEEMRRLQAEMERLLAAPLAGAAGPERAAIASVAEPGGHDGTAAPASTSSRRSQASHGPSPNASTTR